MNGHCNHLALKFSVCVKERQDMYWLPKLHKTPYKARFIANLMRQSACLVFNPITVNNFASLFNCTPVGRVSDSMMALSQIGGHSAT